MLFTDQVGNKLQLADVPKRIISLVPSQTELLHYLGLEEEVIGITKFCIHPNEWFRSKRRIGGTKQLNLALIKELKPDLIIANKEENTKEQIEELQKYFPVYISDIYTLHDACDMISQIGHICDKIVEATRLVDQILEAFSLFNTSDVSPKTVLYLIWHNPLIAVGSDTFIDDMLHRIGLKNVIAQSRYPNLSNVDLLALHPDFIFLSSEPFPFKEKHQLELQHHFPHSTIYLVDGEMFSWYGSRLLDSATYFQSFFTQLK